MTVFYCWHDNMEADEAWEIEAANFLDAAERFAERLWSEGDGWEWLRSGEVFQISDGVETRSMEITVEAEPVFYANHKIEATA